MQTFLSCLIPNCSAHRPRWRSTATRQLSIKLASTLPSPATTRCETTDQTIHSPHDDVVLTSQCVFVCSSQKCLGPDQNHDWHVQVVPSKSCWFTVLLTESSTIWIFLFVWRSLPNWAGASVPGSELPGGLEGGDDADRHERHLRLL